MQTLLLGWPIQNYLVVDSSTQTRSPENFVLNLITGGVQTGIEPEFVLFFYCPEEEMERRLLSRNQGREDDNIDTIRKRFKVYMESSLPVIEYYNSKGKVRKIDAAKPVEEIFEAVKAVFSQDA